MTEAETAGRFIVSHRNRDGSPKQTGLAWSAALVQHHVRRRWPGVTLVEAYREAARVLGSQRRAA